MANCLVTGGAGFIGSHLVAALLARGDRVVVLDNFTTGKVENLHGLNGQLEVIEGDICDQDQVSKCIKDVEYVFHQAAFVSVPASIEDPQNCFSVNVNGTILMLEAARREQLKRFVIASSAAVYGDSDELPLREDTTLNPMTPYAVSKLVIESYTQMYSKVYNLPVVALRYFNVFGPRQSPESDYAAAIPLFIRSVLDNQPPTIFGDGLQTRDFIFIDDVVRANLLAADSPKAPGRIMNVCTGQETKLLDLMDSLQEITGEKITPTFTEMRAGDIYRSYGDNRLANEMMGFLAEISMKSGLSKTMDWMRS